MDSIFFQEKVVDLLTYKLESKREMLTAETDIFQCYCPSVVGCCPSSVTEYNFSSVFQHSEIKLDYLILTQMAASALNTEPKPSSGFTPFDTVLNFWKSSRALNTPQWSMARGTCMLPMLGHTQNKEVYCWGLKAMT